MEEEKKIEEEKVEEVKEKKSIRDYSWIGIGMLFGASLGIATKNALIGIAFGLGMGICFKRK